MKIVNENLSKNVLTKLNEDNKGRNPLNVKNPETTYNLIHDILIKLDGVNYKYEQLSDDARKQIDNISGISISDTLNSLRQALDNIENEADFTPNYLKRSY